MSDKLDTYTQEEALYFKTCFQDEKIRYKAWRTKRWLSFFKFATTLAVSLITSSPWIKALIEGLF